MVWFGLRGVSDHGKGIAVTIQFDPSGWDRIEADYRAWWAGELDRPLVYIENVTVGEPFPRNTLRLAMAGSLDGPSPDEIAEQVFTGMERRRFIGDTFPNYFINFGPGVLAVPLGADLHADENTVWFTVQRPLDLAEADLRLDRDNPWWRRIVDITRAVARRGDGRLLPSYVDLGGNLDILATLVGTETLLMELLDRPELVERACAQVRAAWFEAFDELDAVIRPCCRGGVSWSPTWGPGRSYMLQSDFAYMISPEMFRRFVMPDLEASCDFLDYPFYHLDGVGQLPHLDQMLALPTLRGIQWIPGDGKPPPHEWPDLLRRIREAGKLQQVFVPPDGARKIVRELGGKGFLLAIGGLRSPEEAQALYDELTGG